MLMALLATVKARLQLRSNKERVLGKSTIRLDCLLVLLKNVEVRKESKKA
jgi:hypothetical protein